MSDVKTAPLLKTFAQYMDVGTSATAADHVAQAFAELDRSVNGWLRENPDICITKRAQRVSRLGRYSGIVSVFIWYLPATV